MTAAMAMPGDTASPFLIHYFGGRLDGDDRFVVERFRVHVDGDFRPVEAGTASAKGRRKAKRIVGVEEEIDEQRLDRIRVMTDPAIAVRALRRVLQTVPRRLARQRLASPPARLQPAQKRARNGIAAQLVMVHKVLVAQRDPEHTLAHQRRHIVHNTIRRATVRKAARKPIHKPYRPVRRPQKQRAGIRSHPPATEIGHDIAAFQACKSHPRRATLCVLRRAPLQLNKSLSQKNFLTSRAPMDLTPVRNPD